MQMPKITLLLVAALAMFASAEAATAKASHILMKDEAALQAVKEEIANGASFADKAKEHSTCPSGAPTTALPYG
jgi:parvulin-like peptidyl-prolyl isomerase